MEILHHRLMKERVQRRDFSEACALHLLETIVGRVTWSGVPGILLGLAYFCVRKFMLTYGLLCQSPEIIFGSNLPVCCWYNSFCHSVLRS